MADDYSAFIPVAPSKAGDYSAFIPVAQGKKQSPASARVGKNAGNAGNTQPDPFSAAARAHSSEVADTKPERFMFGDRLHTVKPGGEMVTGDRSAGLLNAQQQQKLYDLGGNPFAQLNPLTATITSGANIAGDVTTGHAISPLDAAVIAQTAGGGLMHPGLEERLAPLGMGRRAGLGASVADRVAKHPPLPASPAADYADAFAKFHQEITPGVPEGVTNAALPKEQVNGPLNSATIRNEKTQTVRGNAAASSGGSLHASEVGPASLARRKGQTGKNAPPELSNAPLQAAQAKQGVLDSTDRSGEALRTPGNNGDASRQAASDRGARTSQERGRSGQPPGKSGGLGAGRAQETPPPLAGNKGGKRIEVQAETGTVVEGSQPLQGMPTGGQAARSKGDLSSVLAEGSAKTTKGGLDATVSGEQESPSAAPNVRPAKAGKAGSGGSTRQGKSVNGEQPAGSRPSAVSSSEDSDVSPAEAKAAIRAAKAESQASPAKAVPASKPGSAKGQGDSKATGSAKATAEIQRLLTPEPTEAASPSPPAPSAPNPGGALSDLRASYADAKSVKELNRIRDARPVLQGDEERAAVDSYYQHRQRLSGGSALRSGVGPTTGGGEDKPLIDLPGALSNASEKVRSTVDLANNLVSEGASYTRRTAPDVFRSALRMVNSSPEAEAGVEKLRAVFEKHGRTTQAQREEFGAILNASKQIKVGAEPAIPEDQVKAFMADPKNQALMKDYVPAVDSLYDAQRTVAGSKGAKLLGEHTNAWMPSVAVDAEGVPYSKAHVSGGAGLTKATYVPNDLVGEHQFTGTGTYLNDPLEAHHNQLMMLNKSAGQRATLAEMSKSGALQPLTQEFKGTITYNGQEVPAVKVDLAGYGITPEQMKRIGLPTRMVDGQLKAAPVVMSRRVDSELRPLFQAQMNPVEHGGGFYDKAIASQLYSAGELGAHAVTLPSVAGSAAAGKGISGSVPFFNFLRGAKKMLSPGFSAEDRANANILAARAGIRRPYPTNPEMKLPEDEGLIGRTSTKALKASGLSDSAAAKVKAVVHQPGAAVLYSRKGLFNNVVTGTYKMMKAAGASDAEIVDTLRALPSHTKQLEAIIPHAIKRTGFGTFYGTGKSVLKQAFNPPGGAPTLAKRTAGLLAFATIAAKLADKDHKFWWERGLGIGEFVRAKDKDGKDIVGSVGWDRISRAMLETPNRIIRAKNAGATPQQIALEAAAGVGSQAVRPATGGPLSAALQQVTGKAAYAVRNREKSGIELMDTPTSKLSYTNPDRIWEAIRQMIPATGYAYDTSSEYSASDPLDKKWATINLWLRRLGQPQFKTRNVAQEKGYERQNEAKRRQTELRAEAQKKQRSR